MERRYEIVVDRHIGPYDDRRFIDTHYATASNLRRWLQRVRTRGYSDVKSGKYHYVAITIDHLPYNHYERFQNDDKSIFVRDYREHEGKWTSGHATHTPGVKDDLPTRYDSRC